MQNCGFKTKYYYEGYIVFVDNTSLWWLKLLKKGFRHCYIVMKINAEKNEWLELNPMSNQLYVFKHSTDLHIDYINFLRRKKGITLLPVKFYQAPLKCAPIGVFSCVEFVKRLLGIHKFWLQTPYQLYKFLINNQK